MNLFLKLYSPLCSSMFWVYNKKLKFYKLMLYIKIQMKNLHKNFIEIDR